MYKTLFKHFFEIKKFDKITQNRLKIVFILNFTMSLFMPTIAYLKGNILIPSIISMIFIISTITPRTNKFIISKFNVIQMYYITIFLLFMLLILINIYTLYPFVLVIFILLIEIGYSMFVYANSIVYVNYVSEIDPKKIKEFQIIRNNMFGDSMLLGFIISTIFTTFFELKYSIIGITIFYLISLIYFLKLTFELKKELENVKSTKILSVLGFKINKNSSQIETKN